MLFIIKYNIVFQGEKEKICISYLNVSAIGKKSNLSNMERDARKVRHQTISLAEAR